jgi:Flp pilus assembly protein TadD
MCCNRSITCFLALACGAAVWFVMQDRTHSSGDRLEQFEGRIGNNRFTYDSVKSDLAVRAAQALKRGDMAEAETLYRRTVELYPDDAESHSDLAACLFFQERYADARREDLKALELDPHSASARYGLGCCAYKEKQYPEARDQLLQAAAIREADASTHRVLALVYLELNERDCARMHYERAVALDSTIADDDIRRRLADPAMR